MGSLIMAIVRYQGVERFTVLDCVGYAVGASHFTRGEYTSAAVYFFGFIIASAFASAVAKLTNPVIDPPPST